MRRTRLQKEPKPVVNSALACVEDTLRLLLEEARQAQKAAAAKRGTQDEAFEIGRSEALIESLHTWANQLQTFELDSQLNQIGNELREFLSANGY
jgi:hypothetical protein